MALIGHLELPSNTRGIGVGEEIVVMTRAEHEELRAEVERLRAGVLPAELRERARDFVDLLGHLDAPEAAHEADEPQTWRRHYENMRTITAALTEALDEEVAGWAGRPELYLAYQAACDATGRTAEPAPAHIAPEESETPAPGTPEWAESAPLDEVRAWLDGRGRRSVAHYHDVGWEANLWGDRGTRIARARAETEEAALRALAAANEEENA